MQSFLCCIAGLRRPWRKQERDAVMSKLGQFVLTKTLPGKSDIEPWLKDEACLRNRSWINVKDFVRNMMSKKCST